ncbi:FG-GAP repeat domain-containing protein, partial [Pyxidicoccus sp. 3LFB2]
GSPPATRTVAVALAAPSRHCEWELDGDPVSDVPRSESQYPLQLAHGDFDRDGKQDMLSLVHGELLRGLGNGRFAEPVTSGLTGDIVGQFLYATVDLNRDGVLDVVAGHALYASEGYPAVTRLWTALGQGDGSFRASQQRFSLDATFPANSSHLVHDLDRDGVPEVMLSADGRVQVLRSTGDGQLTGAFTDTAFPKGPLVAGDFNEDGLEDLVVVGESLHAFYGQGLFAFTPELLGPVATYVRAATAADFNGDGHLDLAVNMSTNALSGRLYLLSGDGQGRFSAPVLVPTPAFHVSTDVLLTGDLDGNGHQDLAWVDREERSVVTLLGRGDGTFAATSVDVDAKSALVLADLDGSGTPDRLVEQSAQQDFVRVLRELGAEPARRTFGEGPVTADFDGDGWDDVASLPGGTTLRVHLTRAGGEPVHRDSVVQQEDVRLMPGHFDADATVDLLALPHDDSRGPLLLLRGLGDGTFAAAEVLPVGAPVTRASAGDVDGDGDLDVACATSTYERATNTWRHELRLLPGQGDGTFGPVRIIHPNLFTPELALRDMDGDDRADLVVLRFLTSPDSSRTYLGFGLFKGGADGTLTEAPGLAPTSRCESIASTYSGNSRLLLEDLDDDGHVDVTLACNTPGSLSTFWGQGTLRFTEAAPIAMTGTARGLVSRDVDGDGRKDLVVASPRFDSVCTLRALGPRAYEAPHCYATMFDTRDVAVLDVDHDGALEVLAGNRDSHRSVLLRPR